MFDWFLIAVVAYVLMAFSQVTDKVFLGLFFRESAAYAAFVGLFGALMLIAWPWTLALSASTAVLAVLAGAIFIAALLPFLKALQTDEATRIIPLTGAIVPLATVLFERLFLGLRLSGFSYAGIGALVVGAVLLTHARRHSKRRSRAAARLAILAAFLFAASFVAGKYIYDQAGFLTGFVWMRAGGALAAALIITAMPRVRRDIRHVWQRFHGQAFGLYAANQGVAGLGFVLQGYAIHLANAALVTAMQGVQYVFVIFFVVLLSRRRSALLDEKITREVILEKLTAAMCLIAGLALLAI